MGCYTNSTILMRRIGRDGKSDFGCSQCDRLVAGKRNIFCIQFEPPQEIHGNNGRKSTAISRNTDFLPVNEFTDRIGRFLDDRNLHRICFLTGCTFEYNLSPTFIKKRICIKRNEYFRFSNALGWRYQKESLDRFTSTVRRKGFPFADRTDRNLFSRACRTYFQRFRIHGNTGIRDEFASCHRQEKKSPYKRNYVSHVR